MKSTIQQNSKLKKKKKNTTTPRRVCTVFSVQFSNSQKNQKPESTNKQKRRRQLRRWALAPYSIVRLTLVLVLGSGFVFSPHCPCPCRAPPSFSAQSLVTLPGCHKIPRHWKGGASGVSGPKGLASSRAGALSFVFIHSVRAFLAFLGIQRGRAVLRAGILVDARDVSYSVTENQVVIPVWGIVDAKLREHHQYHRKCELGMSPTNTTQYHTPNGNLKKKKKVLPDH